jgi:hypothetical protein
MERQSDTLLLLLYYSDLFYFAQYVCVKLSQSWQDFTSETSRWVDLNTDDELCLTYLERSSCKYLHKKTSSTFLALILSMEKSV